MTHSSIAVVGLALSLAACSPASSEGPLRSPSQDYRPPPPSTSDGRVVGADGVDPRDRLEEGPSVGGDGKPAPGWEVDAKGVRYDKKKRVGGAVEQREEK